KKYYQYDIFSVGIIITGRNLRVTSQNLS
ncbi:hypothetical protein DMW05_22425, partial [Vibrio parahaemolyticus]|nr:hypothetical protein [Vibrio parahaemolyticus]EGQ8441318.1 hypothetical protein [Vibrio parahaemolyticus]EGR2962809.1 hypothetical protein [Vibrio parahaemolyticus]